MTHDLLPRPEYTNRILPYVDKGIIKVLTGQRRVGKSYVLKQLMKEVQERNPQANIIAINMEDFRFRHISDASALEEYLRPLLAQKGRHYLFIDEVQEIKDFQHCLRNLLLHDSCDIYCTGSNGDLLSGELATLLTGRYISFDIHSLSYREFLRFHRIEKGVNSLQSYLIYGGMPYLSRIGLNQKEQLFEYLSNVFSSILLRDIMNRGQVRNPEFMETLCCYLADNTGKLLSASNISKFLKAQRTQISVPTILSYLKLMANAYLIHRILRAEVRGLKHFEVGEKIYFEDLGICHTVFDFDFHRNVHQAMENAVCLHLMQRGYKVYVGKNGVREIDFVAEKNGQGRIYVQVSLTVMGKSTAEREFGNLKTLKDNYPKYVVTLNDMSLTKTAEPDISHLNLEDFLLMEL